MIRFAENLNKMIAAGLGGALEAPSTEVAIGHHIRYLESSGAVASFETNIAAPIRSLRVTMEPIQEGTGDPSPDNIRPITGRDSVTVWREASYDPSADPALTIQLGQTVYGGTVDVVSGVLTVERKKVTLTGTENTNMRLTWGHVYIFTDLKIGDASKLYAISNQYKPGANYWGEAGTGDILTNQNNVIIMDDRFNTVEAWNAHVAELYANDTPIEICYRLAEPFTIQLDPVTLSTLKGDNNVWSDVGNISLEYPYYEETEGY